MTREELKELVRESLEEYNFSNEYMSEQEEIAEAEAYAEQCDYIYEAMLDAYFENYVLTEDYMEEDEISLIESVIMEAKVAYYNNAENSRNLRDQKHKLLQAGLAKKNKVSAAISKVTNAIKTAIRKLKPGSPALGKQDLLKIAKNADTDNVLSDSQIQKVINSTEVTGLLTKSAGGNVATDKAERIKNIKDRVHSNKGLPSPKDDKIEQAVSNAESVIGDIKKSKEEFEAEILTGDVLDADGNVIKDKVGSRIKDKLGSGFKNVKGTITATFKNPDGSINKKAAAIAAVATALVGSISAGVALKAKKKKLEKSKDDVKEDKK